MNYSHDADKQYDDGPAARFAKEDEERMRWLNDAARRQKPEKRPKRGPRYTPPGGW